MTGTTQITESWQDWRNKVWRTLAREFEYPGMIAFEQWALRSKKEKRCIDCGKPGIVEQPRSKFVGSVSHYWMCQECHDYWQSKKD